MANCLSWSSAGEALVDEAEMKPIVEITDLEVSGLQLDIVECGHKGQRRSKRFSLATGMNDPSIERRSCRHELIHERSCDRITLGCERQLATEDAFGDFVGEKKTVIFEGLIDGFGDAARHVDRP